MSIYLVDLSSIKRLSTENPGIVLGPRRPSAAACAGPLAHDCPVFGGMFWLSEKRFSGS